MKVSFHPFLSTEECQDLLEPTKTQFQFTTFFKKLEIKCKEVLLGWDSLGMKSFGQENSSKILFFNSPLIDLIFHRRINSMERNHQKNKFSHLDLLCVFLNFLLFFCFECRKFFIDFSMKTSVRVYPIKNLVLLKEFFNFVSKKF
jgi:hypothetical protein